MKILHVSPSYYPAFEFGGPIQSVHQLNTWLAKQQVSVDVFTTNAGLREHPGIRLHTWQMLDGLRVKYFPYSGYVHYNLSPSLLSALFKAVKSYDLVHITAVWNFPVWAAAAACRYHGVPYVISPRGTIYPETIALKSAKLKKFYYRLIAKGCLTNAAAIHYTTDDEKNKVSLSLGLNAPAIVLPNGLEVPDLSALPAFSTHFPALSGQQYILFLGRIHPKKGLDLLAKAFGEIYTQYPGVWLVIAGYDTENYATEIRKMLHQNGTTPRTLFTGELQGEKKWAAYRDATLFVLPSYSENFGMAVAEAMMCQTPVVISDQVGIAAEVLREQAGIVTTADAASVAQGIAQVLDRTEEARKMAQRGQQMAQQHYHIAQVAKDMKNAYEQIIQNRKNP